MIKKYKKTFIVLFLCFFIALFAAPIKTTFAKESYKELQLFAKVLTLIQEYYIEKVDIKKLIYGGIQGVLDQLDPHSYFLSPEIYSEFKRKTSGKFSGIGIEIAIRNNSLIIIAPIEDSPAWKAGLEAGDRIISINGESTKGFSLSNTAQKIKEKNNKVIKLEILRKGLKKPKIYSIKRSIIQISSVKYTDLGDGYMYIRLTSFITNTSQIFHRTIKKHNLKYKKINGMILDLRKNPGGLLNQAVKMSNFFLKKGIIVSTRGKDEKKQEVLRAKSDGTLPIFPMIVLIDEHSASASEILAGALKDNKRALLMGKRSFGKGSVQSVIQLGEDTALKLTVARYYTPKGISIQAEGITPDIELKNINPTNINNASSENSLIREEDIKGHLTNNQTTKLSKKMVNKNKKKSKKEQLLEKDPHVSQAYNYLKAWKVMQK